MKSLATPLSQYGVWCYFYPRSQLHCESPCIFILFFFFPFFFSLPTVTFSKRLPFLSSSQSYLMDIQQLTLPPGLRKDGGQHTRRLSSLLLTLPAFTFPSGFTLMLSPASEVSAHHSSHSIPPLPTLSAAACHSFISTLLLWSSKVPSLFSQ